MRERCKCGLTVMPSSNSMDGMPPGGGNPWSEPVGAGSVVEWRYATGMGEYTVLVCLRTLAVSWFTSRTLTVFHMLNMGTWIGSPTGQQNPIEGEAMDWLLERWTAYKADQRWGVR